MTCLTYRHGQLVEPSPFGFQILFDFADLPSSGHSSRVTQIEPGLYIEDDVLIDTYLSRQEDRLSDVPGFPIGPSDDHTPY